MDDNRTRVLTERQRQVAELLATQFSLKEIAGELEISESAVNKHVSTLKQVLGAASRRQIVLAFEAMSAAADLPGDCRKPSCRNSHLPPNRSVPQKPVSNDPGLIAFADAGALAFDMRESADWHSVFEPRIVPKWLDGDNAVFMRLLVMAGLLFAMLLLPIIAVASLESVGTVIGH